jgi:hypothetical protein
MEKRQISAPVPMEQDNYQAGPSNFFVPMDQNQYQYNQKRPQSMQDVETGLNSSATSIHHGLEKHEADHTHIDINDPNRPKFKFRQRLKHFTWAWYTFPMSTGGLSLLLFAQPHVGEVGKKIGVVVYALNVVLFTVITVLMLARFILHRGTLTKSLSHEREGFFFPTFFLAIATLVTSTQRYAIPDNDVALTWAIKTVFWGYVTVTLILAVGQYSYVFAAHSFGLQTMSKSFALSLIVVFLRHSGRRASSPKLVPKPAQYHLAFRPRDISSTPNTNTPSRSPVLC